MNNPFDYTPDAECTEAFRELTMRLTTLKESTIPSDVNFIRELEEGKMLGVMIAADDEGKRHPLFAFSGQVGDGGFYHDGFVEPVFDYLQPGGYFKIKEAEISRQNIEIGIFDKDTLYRIRTEFEKLKQSHESILSQQKERYRLSKLERLARRESGDADADELEAMIRQSQFEKAEINRLKKRLKAELEPLATQLENATKNLEAMKEKRRQDSEHLQKWLFSNFKLLNARGESKNLSDIFANTTIKVPPSGAGECCAPKLLQTAYLRGWRPVSIAEYWYGKPKGGEIRIHGCHYPACRGKCLPVLGWMLQGLCVEPPLNGELQSIADFEPEIIYENEWFCIVNKPGGMLSVPGKGSAISLQEWLRGKYGLEKNVKVAHRLDQDTSGLIVATFGQSSYKTMQTLFATRKVKKTYIAELEGDYVALGLPGKGLIELPIFPDWLDRPRQLIDFDNGKPAATDYEFISQSQNRSRIAFHPLTGRTHQLRVHSASEKGLGMPIVGDRIYGRNSHNSGERLHLHAHKLEFTFPIDSKHYSFESPLPF